MNSKRFLQASILAFLIPLFVAFYNKIWITAITLLGVTIFSFLYHYHDQKRYYFYDNFFAWVLIASNFYICYLGNFSFPYFLFVVVLVFTALYQYFYLQNKDFLLWHSFWHITSAMITLFSILTYL